MNRTILTVAFALVVLPAAGSVAGAQGTAQPRPQAPATANVPVSKMAVIYSEAFQDPKNGIARFTVTLSRLNSEFQKIQDELTQTATRLKGLQEEITRLQQAGVTTPAQIQTKIDALDSQKREYTRKGEDAKAQYQRRYQELFQPLQEDVTRALDAYGKARGITMIIDGSQTPILYVADTMDITRAFISEYNLKNPSTAQATPPK
ncbi:MAG TPA: OmpH family outer membrane protein [Pyrinomonadaceae bacterium]|nr:OmpH family outer membrane protein [Pyrinomonadaceae bacterium]